MRITAWNVLLYNCHETRRVENWHVGHAPCNRPGSSPRGRCRKVGILKSGRSKALVRTVGPRQTAVGEGCLGGRSGSLPGRTCGGAKRTHRFFERRMRVRHWYCARCVPAGDRFVGASLRKRNPPRGGEESGDRG